MCICLFTSHNRAPLSCSDKYYGPYLPTGKWQITTTYVIGATGCAGAASAYAFSPLSGTGNTCPSTNCSSSGGSYNNGYTIYSSSACLGTLSPTVTTGYFLSSGSYASTDTTCALTPQLMSLSPLGACIATSTTSSIYYAADSANNVYKTSYSSSKSCAGLMSSSLQTPQPCSCAMSSCTKGGTEQQSDDQSSAFPILFFTFIPYPPHS